MLRKESWTKNQPVSCGRTGLPVSESSASWKTCGIENQSWWDRNRKSWWIASSTIKESVLIEDMIKSLGCWKRQAYNCSTDPKLIQTWSAKSEIKKSFKYVYRECREYSYSCQVISGNWRYLPVSTSKIIDIHRDVDCGPNPCRPNAESSQMEFNPK